MTPTLLVSALAVFLAGFCAGTLAVLVVSMHRGARRSFLSANHAEHAGAIARRALTGTRDTHGEDR
jgi:hypothetical protein